jgi:hypothetical protein
VHETFVSQAYDWGSEHESIWYEAVAEMLSDHPKPANENSVRDIETPRGL